jgi:putative transposase
VKLAFVAKHRGIWPAGWMCGALGVSRGGFYAWLTRPPSRRSRSDEELSAKVRTSFIGSDRTYGARRTWRDVLADDVSCGLHRIERLMRQQALRARPRRRRLPSDSGSYGVRNESRSHLTDSHLNQQQLTQRSTGMSACNCKGRSPQTFYGSHGGT